MMERILGPIPTHMIQKTRYTLRLMPFVAIAHIQTTEIFFNKVKCLKSDAIFIYDLVNKSDGVYTEVNLCINVFLSCKNNKSSKKSLILESY